MKNHLNHTGFVTFLCVGWYIHIYIYIKTIKYYHEEVVDDSGKINQRIIEKQTDANRLEKVPWDDEKTWEILQM